MKAVKESVAVVIRRADGGFLVALRPAEPDDPLAGAWGFPAVTRRPGESGRAAAQRIGPLKLGVALAVGAKVGERTGDRGDHVVRMVDYDASITDGTLVVPQPDHTVTQYVAWRFTRDPAVLFDAARRGSLCAQIYLQATGRDWL